MVNAVHHHHGFITKGEVFHWFELDYNTLEWHFGS